MSVSRPDRPLRIGVIGTSRASALELEWARAIGGALAEAGAVVLCGGLGGVMAAVAEGAASRGGMTVGILPTRDAADANPWITLPIATSVGEARNLAIVHSAEALIAIGKGHGTLSEIAFALKARKSVFGLGTWDVASDVVPVTDPAEAAQRVLAAALASRGECG